MTNDEKRTAYSLKDLGPSGQRIRDNVKRLREAQGWSITRLAEQLKQNGSPIPRTALSRIESGHRKVDVDELVALAVALDVSPVSLLLPPEDTGEPVEITNEVSAPWEVAWRWMHGEIPIRDYGLDTWAPKWIPPNRPYEGDVLAEIQNFLDYRVRNPFTIELERDGANHYSKAEMVTKSLRPSATMKRVSEARREHDKTGKGGDGGADMD